jgi:enoyl-CoA hydratase/carnithine racemase
VSRPAAANVSGTEVERLTGLCADAGITLHVGARRWDVVLSRPGQRNAQTPATWRALERVGAAVVEHRPDVVVLRALGPSFSAGLDRAMLTSGLPGEPGVLELAAMPDDELEATIEGFQRGFSWWRDVDTVTVAAVQGHAVGAGFQLALACDVRILADDAQLAMRETSLGLVPDLGGTAPLVEAVGYAVALELCTTGRWMGADEAVTRGLASRAVPRAELEAAVDEIVTAMLSAPRGAVAATKALLRNASRRGEEEQRALERAMQAVRLRDMAEEARRTRR